MKTAKVTIFTIRLSCPECNEELTNQDDAYYFTADDYELLPKTITCPSCELKFRKPSVKI
jgi:C4-type Zn-finger protein